MGYVSQSISVFCPAKVNLFLAVTGRREDGFHDIISIVSKCEFGDRLIIHYDERALKDHLIINGADLPIKGNTVLKAASLLREKFNFEGGFKCELQKNIPFGAGLGGGSSNGAMALKAMAELIRIDLKLDQLLSIASEIGSDCPLFLLNGSAEMRGRGEWVRELANEKSTQLRGKSLLIIKPELSISTPKAYRLLAERNDYQAADMADEKIRNWKLAIDMPLPPIENDFENLLPLWIPSMALILKKLKNDLGLRCGMSGSGSAIFVFLDNNEDAEESIRRLLEVSWGHNYFYVRTRIQ